MVNDILKQMEFVTETVLELFKLVDKEIQHATPINGKMSVWEVCSHLSQIPGADLRILKGYSNQQMSCYYQETKSSTLEEMGKKIIKGLSEIKVYYTNIPDEELTRTIKTYWGAEYSKMEWLIQISNHLAHHRAQLYQYLLYLNQDVQIVLFR